MKEKIKIHLKRMGIAYILLILLLVFKVYRNNKINDFYTLSKETLIDGTYTTYDDNLNIVGNISYKRNGEKLIVSINGEEIIGETTYFEDVYHFQKIELYELQMTLNKYGNEFYYFYDTGNSVIIICLLQSWFTNYKALENLSKKLNKQGITKDRQTFMFLNIDYETYQYALDNKSSTIQNHFTYPVGDGQLYRCFFIQEDL